MFGSQLDFERSLPAHQRGGKAQTRENSLDESPNPYVGDYEDEQLMLPLESRLPSIGRENAKYGTANSALGHYQNRADAQIFRNDARYHQRESATFESNTFKDIKDFERRNFSKEGRLREQLKAARDFEDFHKDQQKISELKKVIEKAADRAEDDAPGRNDEQDLGDHRDSFASRLLEKNRSKKLLEENFEQCAQTAKSRKVSPPGLQGIESVTALGNTNASPISNYYCTGYQDQQKYTIGKLET